MCSVHHPTVTPPLELVIKAAIKGTTMGEEEAYTETHASEVILVEAFSHEALVTKDFAVRGSVRFSFPDLNFLSTMPAKQRLMTPPPKTQEQQTQPTVWRVSKGSTWLAGWLAGNVRDGRRKRSLLTINFLEVQRAKIASG